MSRKGAKRAGSGARIALIILCVFLSIVLALLIAATVYAERMFALIRRPGTTPAPVPTQATISAPPVNPTVGATVFTQPVETVPAGPSLPRETNPIIEPSADMINVLLVGCDRGGQRTDTIMLCTVNKPAKTITLTSFLRDTYVYIPDYFSHKLNTAFYLGGIDTLRNTLQDAYGIVVDGYVIVDFSGFIDIVNAMGGIEMDLTYNEVWYMESAPWDGLNSSGWNLSEGTNLLNGDQTLAYARIREVNDSEGNPGDFGRTNRQRRVISKILEKAKQMNMFQINDVLVSALSSVTTDFTDAEIVNYIMDVLPLLKDLNLKTQQIPSNDNWYLDWVEQDGGLSIVSTRDKSIDREILRQIMTGEE